MTERDAIIQNEHGIHCRPTAVIIKSIGDYAGEITIDCGGSTADPRSMLALMSLCLVKGTALTIRVNGPGEEEMADRLKELFETNFDFDRD